MYKKNDFGRDLFNEVNKNFDIEYLSSWAHEKYLDNASKLEKDTYMAIMIVISMTNGEEFEYTKDELLELAKKLQQDD